MILGKTLPSLHLTAIWTLQRLRLQAGLCELVFPVMMATSLVLPGLLWLPTSTTTPHPR